MADTLHTLRERIDALDAQLVDLLLRRVALVDEVSARKRREGLPVIDASREAAVVAKARERAGADCADDAEALLRIVMERSRMRQRAQRS